MNTDIDFEQSAERNNAKHAVIVDTCWGRFSPFTPVCLISTSGSPP